MKEISLRKLNRLIEEYKEYIAKAERAGDSKTAATYKSHLKTLKELKRLLQAI